MSGPHIEGYEILHVLDSRAEPGVLLAAAHHKIWGAHIYRSEDSGVSWASLPSSPAHPAGRFTTALRAVWFLAESPHDGSLYAGIDPAGLFRSADRGASWEPVEGLNEHATRTLWEPAKGGFSVHSIHVDPATPTRLYAAVSAGGAFRSLDGGEQWAAINQGVRAENRPDRFPVAGHNIHRLVMHPARPDRLYRQCYSGVYRSDDGGDHWTEITGNLPSDFGYALVCDPADPDIAWQIPVSSSHMRTVPDGCLRVYRTRNAGDSWESVSDGLPDRHVYVSVLREAMDFAPGEAGGVYFGTTAGQVFARHHAQAAWQSAADYLPRVLSLRARLEP
jgi:photosystem II stability/assembly factor-like uncharacterized protein